MKVKHALMALALMSAGVAFGGPKVSVLGDSYSTFEGVIPPGNANWYFKAPRNQNHVKRVEECWWSIVITNLCGTLERNESWSGSMVCNTGYEGKDVPNSSFIARTMRLGNPDLILVCGATNDSWAKSPIGEYKYADWSLADLATFRPAMAKLLSDLKSLYPKARVYFILNDCLSAPINDSVHTVCARYNVPCVDLREIHKQRGHPSVVGMKSIAEQVTAAVQATTKQ